MGGQALYYAIGIAISLAIGIALGNGLAKEQGRPRLLPISIVASAAFGILVGYALSVFMGFVNASATMR